MRDRKEDHLVRKRLWLEQRALGESAQSDALGVAAVIAAINLNDELDAWGTEVSDEAATNWDLTTKANTDAGGRLGAEHVADAVRIPDNKDLVLKMWRKVHTTVTRLGRAVRTFRHAKRNRRREADACALRSEHHPDPEDDQLLRGRLPETSRARALGVEWCGTSQLRRARATVARLARMAPRQEPGRSAAARPAPNLGWLGHDQ